MSEKHLKLRTDDIASSEQSRAEQSRCLRVLVACEESQAVCTEFRKLGHEAYSCDIIECSGGHPEWHIKGDCLPLLNGNCQFDTCDGKEHKIDGKWDLIIAHPPCTDLAVSGARHFEKKRADGRQRKSIEFFCKFFEADCDRIMIENPVGIISGNYVEKHFPDLAKKYNLPRKYTQKIQPYEYGHKARKTTCLWLKGLSPLKPTNIVDPKIVTYTCKNGKRVTFSEDYCFSSDQNNSVDRSERRSKTYAGIAKAMATQWSEFVLSEIAK